MSNEELMSAYREQLRRLYGDECADRTKLYYIKGWFYLALAQKTHTGQYGVWFPADAIRRKELERMVETLKARKSNLEAVK